MLRANKPITPIYLRPFVYTSDLGIAPRLHNIETDFLIYGLGSGITSTRGGELPHQQLDKTGGSFLAIARKDQWCLHHRSLAKTEAVASGFDELADEHSGQGE